MKIQTRHAIVSALLLWLHLPLPGWAAAPANGSSLKLLTQNAYLPQLPVLVRVEIHNASGERDRDLWDAAATLAANPPGVTLSTNSISMRNGLGSALVTFTGGGNFTLTATIGSFSTNRTLQDVSGLPATSVGGVLPGASTTWSGVIRITNDVTVPVGHTLTIQSNTLVTINGVASGTVAPDLFVNGTINSLGTELHPVTITCADAGLRWGQIRHNSAPPSVYRHTTITRGGRAAGEGHTGQAPVIRPNNSTITFENCNITDHADASGTPGKIMYAIGSDLTFRDCVLARARMGPEIQGTALLCTNTWITDMRGPDDSDGIYLHGQQAGQQLLLTGCVLAAGDDDGIDTLDSVVNVENCLIRDWTNPNEDAKGISVFNQAVHVRRCLIVNCWVAVSAKWSGGTPAFVTINNSTLIGISNTVAATLKANAPGPFIDFRITNSILWGVDALKTDFGPTNFTVRYCDISESWPGTGNLNADPIFVNSGANDYHLEPASPCIDTADPASPLDSDGSRVEMGVFPFLATPNPMIPLASEWKYLDDGSDQGTNWTSLAFNDNSWASGPAQLGYSSNPPELDEATVVNFGPDPNNKYITTYFRKRFFVGTPSAFTGLQLRLLRDDGAVVYLNGQEIWRTNMPLGAIDYRTLTPFSIGGVDESIFLTNIISASGLVGGTNVVAVEVHQSATNSSDLSFELELTGLGGGNAPPSVAITDPVNNTVFSAPADITISASASDTDGTVSKVEFFQNGAKLGEDSAEPYSQSWNGVAGGIYALTAVATDNSGASRTSAVVNITVNTGGEPTTNTLIALGSVWRFLDNGTDQGTNWSTLAFDDTGWSPGAAPLGYCGAGCAYTIATVLSYGPNASAKYITTYFRQNFVIDDPAQVVSLQLNLLRDDGAVVHINGREVHRVNMPLDVPITYLTNASSASNYAYEQNTLPPHAMAALVPGTNVFAAEIHQGNGTSSDIVLDAALLGVISAPTNAKPIVSIASPANNTTVAAPANVTITANASDSDGTVTNVAFYANTTKLTDDPASPYSFAWNNAPAGNYALTAVATDDVGLVSTSSVVNLTVSTNTAPPVVANKTPAPGTVTNLSQIAVTFSKPVIGVNASDFLVNGVAASGVSGSGANYSFAFAQPAYGTVSITWAASHGITDVFTPPNAFDRNGPGATWQYQLNDAQPPVIASLEPFPDSTVATLTLVSVSFSEAVTGVNASDLLVNSAPAASVTGTGDGPYEFGFTQPAQGVVQLTWAAGHGIRDAASNSFAGGSWSYQLNTNATGIIISEIMYHPSSENILEEYIELFNKGASSVNLNGWRFSAGVQFAFPNVSIPAGSYLVVAADVSAFTNKYPGVTNVIGGWAGFLNNSSEDIDLDDMQGERVDSVRYADEGDWGTRQRGPDEGGHRGWVWFAAHDGLGRSLELINPNLSNNSGQNWASSLSTNGTPGAANSVRSNNIPPMILNAAHFPIVPRTNDQVLISARIVDESFSGLGVTLYHRVSLAATQAFSSVAMRDDGLSGDAVGGDGIYSALLPNRTNNTVVEWYVSATDQRGAIRTWPAAAIAAADGAGPTGQVVNALYQVDDLVYNPTNNQPLYKLIMTEAERAELAVIPSQSNLQGPNSQMNGTFISIDGAGTDVQYLAGFRNRGHGSRTANPPNYRANFRSDDPWKGVTALNINAVAPYVQHVGSVLARKAGIAGAEAIAVQVRVNNQNRANAGAPMFGSYVANEVVNSDWADHHFPTDPNGNVYRATRDIAPFDFSYRGEDPNSYRNTWFKESNVSEDAWSDLIGMLRVMGINNVTSFTTENVRQAINVEQWLRHLAVMNLFGNAETGLNSGYNDDYFMYRGGNDPRFILVYWDLDQILGRSSFASNADIFSATANNGSGQAFNRLLHWPDFEPIYLRILKELLETTFSQANFDTLVDQTLGSYADPAAISGIKTWMNQRRAYVLGLPAIQSATNVPVAIATISGVPRSPTPFNTATFAVGGSGVVAYRSQLNGAGYGAETAVATPIVLNGLSSGTNVVSVIARNSNGVWQAEANATMVSWVVNPMWPKVRLNEVLARNDSAVNHFGTFPDLIELFNEGAVAIDLSGMRLTDDAANPNKFTFPNGTTLGAGSYLTVYASDPDGTPDLHLGFNLDGDGEGVYLFDRVANGNGVLDSVVFGMQLPNLSIGRLGNQQGWTNAGDWRLTQPTFSAANTAQTLGNERGLRLNEWLASGVNPYAEDFIELFNADTLPVALGGLYLSDQPIGAPTRSPIAPLSFIANNGFAVFTADGNPGPTHANFQLAIEQGELGLIGSDLSVIDCVIYGPQVTDVSVGRCPDGALTQETLLTPTPGAPNACPFTPPPPQTVTLIAVSNSWRYYTNGDLGAGWTNNSYPDSAWPQGQGLLAVPHPTRGTNVFPEPVRTMLPPNGTNVTYYFRAHFDVAPDVTFSALQFRHVIDDGAIFYLNGAELSPRFNMNGGAVSFSTLANAGVTDAAYVGPVSVLTSLLRVGDNVFAVEVHQNTINSPDMAFGLVLEALVATNSPAAAGVVINEVLANNATLEELDGSKPDWVEIYNPSSNSVDLADMSLTDSTLTPRRWVFPMGSLLPAGAFLKVRLDPDLPSSATNTGFGLKANGGAVYLFNRTVDGSSLASSVTYGLQAGDFSIGRVPDGTTNWMLNVPTFGAANLAAALGDPMLLRINEWMASPSSGEDWFEIFNPNPQPVNLSRLWLSDNVVTRMTYQIPLLSFIGSGPEAYQRFEADDPPTYLGADHVNFKLDGDGDALAISTPTGGPINSIGFGQQQTGVSQGRLPDGSPNVPINFPTTPTPGKGNFLPLNNVVVNELLSHSDAPLEDAVEFYNPSGDDVDISGWYLSDSQNNLLKYRIPTNRIVRAGSYLVLYEYEFNGDHPGEEFSFSSARGDEVYLSQTSSLGVLTGYRAFAAFGPAENGVSFGRFPTSVGVDFTAMSARTFGVDNPTDTNQFRSGTGRTNAYPKVGPVVINEIMYHPAITNDALEFVELHNILGTPVSLFDSNHPQNTWRLRKGIDFNFPQGTVIPAGGFLVVVSFDPQTDPASLAAFQGAYGTGMTLLGPYSGKLDNAGEDVDLRKPDLPQTQPGPDFGLVPYVVVDRVNYDDAAPWPTSPDGMGASLKRITASLYGNEPVNWTGGTPNPGAPNFGGSSNTAPVLGAIGNKTTNEGSLLTFTAMATDSDTPAQTLTFSLDAGAPSGASIHSSSGAFNWSPSEAQGPGVYAVTVRVTDSGSPLMSDWETISITVNDVNAQPVLAPIGAKTVYEGSLVTFTAATADADLPAQALAYSLDAGAPAGATINATNGTFTWTPAETQGPGSYPVTVRVTDNGSPPLNDSETITITVNETNAAPVLAAIGNRTVSVGQTLSFTAMGTDSDFPTQTLTFGLDPGAPTGASINASSGVFSWTPNQAQGPSTNIVTVRITDNGSPVKSDTETFDIVVVGAPRFISIGISLGLVTIQWTSYPGKTYRVQRTTDLVSWSNLGSTITASGSTASITDPVGGNQQRFYRVLLID